MLVATMRIVKRPLVVYAAGLLSLLLWNGLPLYKLGTGLQVTHLTAAVLSLVFFAGKLTRGNFVIITLARPLSYRTLWVCVSIVFLLAAGLLSSLNAQDLFEVMKFEVNYLIGLLIIIILAESLHEKDEIEFILDCLLLGGLVVCVITFFGFFIPALNAIMMNENGRAEGFMLHPNQWGMMLAAIVPAVATRLATNFRRLDRWIALVILTASIALSGSKANIFIAGFFGPVALVIAGTFRQSLLARLRSVFTTAAAVLIAGLIAFTLLQQFAPKSLTKLQDAANNPMEYRTMLSRQDKWAEAFTIFMKKPLFGIGAGNTRLYLDANHAHNAFVDYLLTMGLFGVTGLTVFLFSIFCLCCYVVRLSMQMGTYWHAQSIGLAFGIASFVLSNQLSNSFRGTTLPIMWVLLGLLVAQGKICIISLAEGIKNESSAHC
jgi:O-antigen ligase